MNISELLELLIAHPSDKLQFVLPTGDSVPPHFHVTEVARVDKTFIDCGGTQRHTTTCQLQLWTADDFEHQLYANKLTKILNLAESILKAEDLSVEIEFGQSVASMYTVGNVVAAFGTLQFFLVGKATDCLAKDKCGVEGCTDARACC